LGRLVGGVSTPSALALFVFLIGIVTDILDGQIARRTRTQSKLGQIGDGEADFCLYLVITLILIQNTILPLWLGLIMLFRFLIPLLAALGSYFLFAHPVRFGSTIWGKYAGLAQCLYFLVLLAPSQLTFLTQLFNIPLLIVTLLLLIIAPIAQIIENLRVIRTQGI
jgi:phosphatidylglycerophosphate synthase